MKRDIFCPKCLTTNVEQLEGGVVHECLSCGQAFMLGELKDHVEDYNRAVAARMGRQQEDDSRNGPIQRRDGDADTRKLQIHDIPKTESRPRVEKSTGQEGGNKELSPTILSGVATDTKGT